VSSVSAPQSFRGERLGLPEQGTSSLATTGQRLGAFVVDALASSLVAALFVQSAAGRGAGGHLPGSWSLIPFAIDYIVGTLVCRRLLLKHGLRGTAKSAAKTGSMLMMIAALAGGR